MLVNAGGDGASAVADAPLDRPARNACKDL
jgi:hypothetical protein